MEARRNVCDACGQANKKWVYFQQPIALQSFNYKIKNQEVLVSFKKAIPKNIQAKKAKLLLFLRTGNQQNTTFYTKVRVVDGDDELVHWTYAHRYPQQAISYNSETIQIPCLFTREIRVKTDHIQLNNCHLMQFKITGYQPA